MQSKTIFHHTKINIASIVTCLIVGIIILFWLNAVFGKKGLLCYLNTKSQLQNNIKSIDELRIKKLRLLNKVNRLNANTLDKDLVEEYAKIELDLADKSEIIITKK